MLSAERARGSVRSHAHAVLGHALQPHDARAHQHGKEIGPEIVQRIVVSDPEVAQRVCVRAQATADPAVRRVALAQPLEMARTANPFAGREEPKAQQHLRIQRRSAGPALARLGACSEATEVHSIEQLPEGERAMVFRNQVVQRDGLPQTLRAIRPLQSDLAAHLVARLRRALVSTLEQQFLGHDRPRRKADAQFQPCQRVRPDFARVLSISRPSRVA